MASVDISDIDKYELLLGLIRGTEASFDIFHVPTKWMAERAINKGYIGTFLQYYIGTDISGDTADPRKYNERRGEGSFQMIVDHLRSIQK